MIKFILPAVILFLIVLFWEKISNGILKKLNLNINYIVMSVFLTVIVAILTLLYF